MLRELNLSGLNIYEYNHNVKHHQRQKSGDIRRAGWLLATATCKTNRQDFSTATCCVETHFNIKSASGED